MAQTIFPIVTHPADVLKTRAQEVAEITEEIQQLVPNMIATMYAAEGIGLAAPQIGISKRIIIVETSDDPRATKADRRNGTTEGKPAAFINPVIEKKSKETETAEEGCLSLPGLFVPVKRAISVELTCTTPEGKQVQIEAAGLIARIFQHEVDHLNGKLIINHLTPLQRFKLRKQLKHIAAQSLKP